jgi:hypothetical protein
LPFRRGGQRSSLQRRAKLPGCPVNDRFLAARNAMGVFPVCERHKRPPRTLNQRGDKWW